MSAETCKCPACAAPLVYDGESGSMICHACGNSYTIDEVMPGGTDTRIGFDMSGSSYAADEAASCQCDSCGAKLVTAATTTSTECPYCGSPVVLTAQIAAGVRPEKVVPFVLDKTQATELFSGYFKGKKLLPNVFRKDNHIAEIRRLFVPYWLFDCDASGDMTFDCEKKHTSREGDFEVTRTKHYLVRRRGSMSFAGIPVDGSAQLDNSITESIEPFDMSKAVDFHPAVLSGAMADRADVNAADCESRAAERVEQSMADRLRATVEGYDTVSVRSRYIRSDKGEGRPVLMPVWLITTRKALKGEEKTYTFAINGQSGELTCDVPADKGKAFAWGAGVFAGVMGVGSLLLHLAGALGSGTALLAGVGSLIAALITVSVLRGQLKNAHSLSDAAGYVCDDTFRLDIRADYFTHETVERRKIEQEKKEA